MTREDLKKVRVPVEEWSYAKQQKARCEDTISNDVDTVDIHPTVIAVNLSHGNDDIAFLLYVERW